MSVTMTTTGHDKMLSGADTPLVSFNHVITVIDPQFCHFLQQFVQNTATLTLTRTMNPKPNPNPNSNTTVITDPQICLI